MRDSTVNLVLGSLLHDIGKIILRSQEESAGHPATGADWINKVFTQSKQIGDCIRFHHRDELLPADISPDSLSYIIFISNNISRGLTHENNKDDYDSEQDLPLRSVFNIINGNKSDKVYEAKILEDGINFPLDDIVIPPSSYYKKIMSDIESKLKNIEPAVMYINSVIDLLESYLTFVPSSANKEQVNDISLFDHSKTTAAVGTCIELYLTARNVSDYKDKLFNNEYAFYDEPCFLLYSCDISGIQDFIYTVSGSNMLKALRARSFYLEMLLEHIADEIMESTGCSRANLLYTGGGHAYILLPNTPETKSLISEAEKKINSWFISNYRTSLFIAMAYTECSANDLINRPEGSYKAVLRDLSAKLSQKKLKRYSVEELNYLNGLSKDEHLRECRECKRSDRLTDEDICGPCNALRNISNGLVRKEFFVISSHNTQRHAIELPSLFCGTKYLTAYDESELEHTSIGQDARIYSKNRSYIAKGYAGRIWMGDYSIDRDFESLAANAQGINRIAVLRADVDNLGKAFTGGFEEKYLTISRTSTFSRMLSLFFKFHINELMNNPLFFLKGSGERRSAAIVYSGGDDMFIVGGWDDCVAISLDVRQALERFTQNTLTLSCGIGIYHNSFPIAQMAEDTGRLEEAAKGYRNVKNSVAVFDSERVFTWREFEDMVIGEKLRGIQKFFDKEETRGSAFIYNLLDLLRGDEQINIARIAYTLAKLNVEQEFSRKFHDWALNAKDKLQLITALEIYIYLERSEN